jgi:hypothetical protein
MEVDETSWIASKVHKKIKLGISLSERTVNYSHSVIPPFIFSILVFGDY